MLGETYYRLKVWVVSIDERLRWKWLNSLLLIRFRFMQVCTNYQEFYVYFLMQRLPRGVLRQSTRIPLWVVFCVCACVSFFGVFFPIISFAFFHLFQRLRNQIIKKFKVTPYIYNVVKKFDTVKTIRMKICSFKYIFFVLIILIGVFLH